jgi:hypothetical protein
MIRVFLVCVDEEASDMRTGKPVLGAMLYTKTFESVQTIQDLGIIYLTSHLTIFKTFDIIQVGGLIK